MVAYLRGYILPGHPQGIRSDIRKEIILQSVSNDLSREDAELLIAFRNSTIPLIKAGSRRGYHQQTSEYINLANTLRINYIGGLPKQGIEHVSDPTKKFVEMYKLFEHTGLLKKISEALS